ncbi:MAG: hypothetical protein M3Z27_06260 [Actinomycetota bacterium]|nr:hypothetical protein [Actinomycetota bacterium]
MTGVGDPGEVGLNVTSRPAPSTAVHCDADGHATPLSDWPLSIDIGVGLPGEAGLNVTSRPETSTAMHREADGHATPVRLRSGPPIVTVLSIVTGVGDPGEVGLNVTSVPFG